MAGTIISGSSTEGRQAVERRYTEICMNIRALDDNSFKLLGLVPLVTGSAILGVLISKEDVVGPSLYLLSIVGALVTFGLFRWEFRNIQICKRLQMRADEIERNEFHVEPGEEQFAIRERKPQPQFKNPELDHLHKFIGFEFTQRRAEMIIYWTAIMGWIALPFAAALSRK